MVARLKSLIRGSKFLYDLYYILGSLFLNLYGAHNEAV